MRNILAVISDGNAGPVLEAALRVARRFNGHIVGLHSLTAEYAVVFGGEMGSSISSEVDRTFEREGHERRDQAHRLFSEFMTAHSVPLEPVSAGLVGPRASWREEDGRQNAVVGLRGRLYDLIIVEQPGQLASIAEATLEDALFESGRPVMMVPKVAASALGEIIAIAWNGSTETATTVALAMPFLQHAKEVIVVGCAPQDMPEPGPVGDELLRTLEGHGLKVSLRTAVGRQRAQGESFLQEAAAAGADLILKGAYTQNRIRQMIFGGATRQMIMASTIPMIMAR